MGGATEAERARVLRMLDYSGAGGPLLAGRAGLRRGGAFGHGGEAFAAGADGRWGQRTYERLIGAPWFGRASRVRLPGHGHRRRDRRAPAGAGGAGRHGRRARCAGGMEELQRELVLESGQDGWGVTIVAMLAALASLVCSVIGALALRRSACKGLLWFRRSVLISLLLSLPIAVPGRAVLGPLPSGVQSPAVDRGELPHPAGDGAPRSCPPKLTVDSRRPLCILCSGGDGCCVGVGGGGAGAPVGAHLR